MSRTQIDVVAKWLVFFLRILEVLCYDIDPETGYH